MYTHDAPDAKSANPNMKANAAAARGDGASCSSRMSSAMATTGTGVAPKGANPKTVAAPASSAQSAGSGAVRITASGRNAVPRGGARGSTFGRR